MGVRGGEQRGGDGESGGQLGGISAAARVAAAGWLRVEKVCATLASLPCWYSDERILRDAPPQPDPQRPCSASVHPDPTATWVVPHSTLLVYFRPLV